MESIIQIFRMSELTIETRIKIIKKLGTAINNQLAGNFTEALVYELVLSLNPDDEIKSDDHYLMFVNKY